jgi:putative FmdB family regulatory protein
MPTYDYACEHCGGFEALRPLALRQEPVACPHCDRASPRVLVAMPRLGCLSGTRRQAMEINERAQHAPQSSGSYQRMRHPAGCGCCTPGRRSATVTTPSGAKTFPAKRPWMISH